MWSCSVFLNWGEWGTIPECFSERGAAAELCVRQDRLPAARCRHKCCRRRRGCTVELRAKLGLARGPPCLSVAASSSSSEVSRMDDMDIGGTTLAHFKLPRRRVRTSCRHAQWHCTWTVHSNNTQAALCKANSSHLAGAATPAACRLAWAGNKDLTMHPTPALCVRCSCQRRHAVLMPGLPSAKPLYRQRISASHSSRDSAATASDVCRSLAALSTLQRSGRAASAACSAGAASAVRTNSCQADPR